MTKSPDIIRSFEFIKSKLKPPALRIFSGLNLLYFSLFALGNLIKARQRNCICTLLNGKNILVLAPHIDDDIIGCGGAILKYLDRGCRVSIVYLTDGGKRGTGKSRDKIIRERRNEAIKVAEEIGLERKDLSFLPGKDGDLLNSNIGNLLSEILERVRPDALFLPIFLDTHNDHFATGKILHEVGIKNCTLLENTIFYFYEVQSPITTIYSNVGLDISEVFERKKKLFNLYRSQKSDFKFVENQTWVNGITLGRYSHCEIFLETDKSGMNNIYDRGFNGDNKYINLRKKLVPHYHSGFFVKSYRSSCVQKKIINELLKPVS